jgi:hypothetical protein
MRTQLGLVLRLLRCEGWRAVRDRVLDRCAEHRRMAALPRLGSSDEQLAPAPVLNLSPLPMAPRRGGSQIQLLDRLIAESQLRPVALLYPAGAGAGWMLERHHGSQRGCTPLPARDRLADLVAEAAARVGTGMVHLECLAGLAPDLAWELRERGLQVILSVHDFSLLCLRPHLLEQPAGKFCSLSIDQQRCRRCLAADGLATVADRAGRRAAGSAALSAAAAVVFPSLFLRSWYEK